MLPVSLIAEISQAKTEWLLACDNFNNADEAFVDAAVWKLQAAIEKYDALMRLAKQKGWEDNNGQYSGNLPQVWV